MKSKAEPRSGVSRIKHTASSTAGSNEAIRQRRMFYEKQKSASVGRGSLGPSVDGWLPCARCASVVDVVGAVPGAGDDQADAVDDERDAAEEAPRLLLDGEVFPVEALSVGEALHDRGDDHQCESELECEGVHDFFSPTTLTGRDGGTSPIKLTLTGRKPFK